MRFNIISTFPKIFDSYFNESIIKRACAKKFVDIKIHDLRKFSRDNHKKVDDRPYGGGPGMVLKIEPIIRTIGSILNLKIKNEKVKIILFSAAGKIFNAKMARDFSKKYDRIIMIAGHYEGVDARIKGVLHAIGYILQEVSIGPYVLTGGELPAMIVVDAVSRHIKGVLGKEESLEEKRHGIGLPVYTRPEIFEYKGKKYRAPKILLSGNHKKIAAWRAMRASH